MPTWTRLFAPELPEQPEIDADGHLVATAADDGSVYDYTDEIALAIDVALVTGRPLLVRGPPGCGKSSLAASIARKMGWRYLEHVVTSRTQARDLLWTFDDVRRLADAQVKHLKEDASYLSAGPLWWAYDPDSARNPSGAREILPPWRRYRARTDLPEVAITWPDLVLLIDEIDKADPDVPNDLLVALSGHRFDVRGLPRPVVRTAEHRPFIVLTTNDERELPGAFRRRCIIIELPYPDAARLITIANLHLTRASRTAPPGLVDRLATRTVAIAEERAREGHRRPGISEFLDALWALIGLGGDIPADGTDPRVDLVLRAALDKESGA